MNEENKDDLESRRKECTSAMVGSWWFSGWWCLIEVGKRRKKKSKVMKEGDKSSPFVRSFV